MQEKEKRLISWNWIVGYLVMWAVRATPEGWPWGAGELVRELSKTWARDTSEWMTIAELEVRVKPLATHDIVQRWSRPARPEQRDSGFDGFRLVELIVLSTWANGVPEPLPHEAMGEHAARPVQEGERVRCIENSIGVIRDWCVIVWIREGEAHLVTEEQGLGAGFVGVDVLRDPSKYERGGMASPRRMTEREVREETAAKRAVESEAQRIDRETREENDRRDRQAEKRSKSIHDAAWFAAYTSSLAGTATYFSVGPLATAGYSPVELAARAEKIADASAALVGERGIVPPSAAFELEPSASALHDTQPAGPTFNITAHYEAGQDPDAVVSSFVADIMKGVPRGEGSRSVSPLETKLCEMLSEHVGEVPEEQHEGAGAVEVLKRILVGHRARRAAEQDVRLTRPKVEMPSGALRIECADGWVIKVSPLSTMDVTDVELMHPKLKPSILEQPAIVLESMHVEGLNEPHTS